MTNAKAKTGAAWPHGGFSFVELVIVLAMITIFLGMALPDFSEKRHSNRLDEAASQLYHSLNMARKGAIKSGATVTLCPSTNGNSCTRTDLEWGRGWLVFQDLDSNGDVGTGEPVLLWHEPVHDSLSIVSSGPGSRRVSFSQTGDARATSGKFRVCHQYKEIEQRVISVSAVGHVRLSHSSLPDCSS